MKDTWHVTTDGSAITHPGGVGQRFPGGWSAIIEHGNEGYVLRGREADTTNVRMELRAVINGLAEVPSYAHCVLHFDCTVVHIVRQRWLRGQPLDHRLVKPSRPLADGDLWTLLAHHFDRLPRIELRMVGRGPHPLHRRAHGIAHAEAKAQAAGLAPNRTVLSRIEKKERRTAVMAELEQQRRQDDIRRRQQVASFGRLGTAFERRGLRHLPECEPGACASGCIIWLNFGPGY